MPGSTKAIFSNCKRSKHWLAKSYPTTNHTVADSARSHTHHWNYCSRQPCFAYHAGHTRLSTACYNNRRLFTGPTRYRPAVPAQPATVSSTHSLSSPACDAPPECSSWTCSKFACWVERSMWLRKMRRKEEAVGPAQPARSSRATAAMLGWRC